MVAVGEAAISAGSDQRGPPVSLEPHVVLRIGVMLTTRCRHSYGTMHRLPRVSPDEALYYPSARDGKVWRIPAGVRCDQPAYNLNRAVLALM